MTSFVRRWYNHDDGIAFADVDGSLSGDIGSLGLVSSRVVTACFGSDLVEVFAVDEFTVELYTTNRVREVDGEPEKENERTMRGK